MEVLGDSYAIESLYKMRLKDLDALERRRPSANYESGSPCCVVQ